MLNKEICHCETCWKSLFLLISDFLCEVRIPRSNENKLLKEIELYPCDLVVTMRAKIMFETSPLVILRPKNKIVSIVKGQAASQLVRESRQKFPSLLEKLFFFLAYFDIVPRPLAPRNESGGRPLFLCRAVGAGRGALCVEMGFKWIFPENQDALK